MSSSVYPCVLRGEDFCKLHHCPPPHGLAFRVRLGNNLVVASMRLACGFAIALWLSCSAAGMASREQDIARSASTDPQAAPAAPVEEAPPKKSTVPAPSRPKKRHKHAVPIPGAPRKIVVREGGASEPAAQIAPDMTPEEAARQRKTAEQILSSTDDQLKRLAERSPDVWQQETIAQIHNYMDGARSALKEGDLRRASTLAQKAHLLSEDLIKH
jgi:hypothetical protein